VIKAYKDGSINYGEAVTLLQPLIADGSQITDTLKAADTELKADTTARWIRKVRKAYLVGEYDTVQAGVSLKSLGVDPSRAAELVELWRADRDGRYKEPAVGMLRKWAMDGLITADDMYNRLTRLGYNELDANRIIAATQHDINVAATKEFEKVMHQLEKNYKDSKAVQKATQAELEKRLAAIQKEQEKIQKEIDKRDKLIKG